MEPKIIIEIHERAGGVEVYRWRCPRCPFIVSASTDDAVKTGRLDHLVYEAATAAVA